MMPLDLTSLSPMPAGIKTERMETKQRRSVLQAIPIKDTRAYSSLRTTGTRGLIAIAGTVIALGTLIGQTTIAGAVASGGVLVVDTGSKSVQHLTGGTVSAVLVQNGDRVVGGQALIQLDQSALAPSLEAALTQVEQNRTRLLRLEAERDGLANPDFPPFSPQTKVPQAVYEGILSTERDQFLRRNEELAGQLSELDERIRQAQSQSQADEAQLASISEQRKIAENQLAKLKSLYEQELVPYVRVAESQQSFTQLRGSEESLRATGAANKGKLAELKVTRIQIERTRRSEVSGEIAQTQWTMTQLVAQASQLQDQVERLTIRAPQDGIVHELGSFADGSVIQAGQKLMLLVPDHDKLLGQVKIRPADIDQLYPGQPVTIQFAAFERATTPSAKGHLDGISPDLVEDPRTGGLYYSARIVPDDIEAFEGTGLKLVPGMPIEVFIKTEDRTIFSYLAKPLLDQLNRAFR